MMTSRFLLTLLALLTGLSVQGAPVSARTFATERAEIGMVATVAEVRQAKLAASLPSGLTERGIDQTAAIPAATGEALIPFARVLLRIDRARE